MGWICKSYGKTEINMGICAHKSIKKLHYFYKIIMIQVEWK